MADPQVKISATIDASGAVTGAAETVAAVNRIGNATKDLAETQDSTAEQTERLNRQLKEHQQWLMQNAFYVHRLAEGFKDLSLGGRAASQGLMDISESLQYMLGPEFAIYAAIAQVVAMLALLVTAHRHRGEAARDAAEAEKSAAKESIDAFTAQVDQYKEGTNAMIESQGALLKSQQESTSEIAKQGEMLKAQAELDKQAALLKLQQGYLLAMSGATTPDQRESIERRYKASQADIEGQTTVNVANLEAQEAAAKAKAAQDQLREQQEDYAKNRKTVDDAQQQKMDADAVFAKYGVIAPRNEKGELTGALTSPATGVAGVPFSGKSASPDVIGDLKEKISDLGLTIASLENEANEPVPTMWRLHESQDQREKDWKENREDYRKTYQIDDLKTQWQQMQKELEDLQNALKTAAQSQAVLGDSELHKKIQEAPDQMFQSGVAVTNAQREAEQKAQAAQLAAQKADQDAQQRKQENDRAEQQARQEQLRTWRDNELNAQKLRLQGQLETAPESGKAGIQAQLAGIDNQEAINKANDKLGFLIHPPSPANNPYGGGIDGLNKRLEQLQNQQEANPAAAKYLDALIQQVAKNLEELKKQSDDWQRSQGEKGPALTPEQLARQSIRDLTTAETSFNNARAQGQGQKDAAEVTRQQLESQQREIAQLKTQIAAREDHSALEPLVKAAEALATPAERLGALQAILAQHVGALQSAHERLQQRVEQNERAINSLKTNMGS